MDDLVEAPPATALETQLVRPRPNQVFQGVLAFFAVVGIGSAVTVLVRPPLRLRVITVERRLPPALPAVAPPAPPLPPPAPRTVTAPPPHIRRVQTVAKAVPKPPSTPLPSSDECHDPLCGLGDLKR